MLSPRLQDQAAWFLTHVGSLPPRWVLEVNACIADQDGLTLFDTDAGMAVVCDWYAASADYPYPQMSYRQAALMAMAQAAGDWVGSMVFSGTGRTTKHGVPLDKPSGFNR